MDDQRLQGQIGETGEQEDQGPQKPVLSLRVSLNIMELELELQRTGTDTLAPVFEDVMEAIAAQGVTTGILEDRIRALCAQPRFNEPVLVARGKAPGVGQDGSVEYKIATAREMRPKVRSDGTVDYRDLGFVQNVRKDQVLCEIHPATKGEDGVDVYGNVLEGRYGKSPDNVAGKNTHYTEDNLQLVADVDGNAEVRKGVVDVINVLRIDGNVDNSTGDISFVGDVQISGDVLSGFKVTSEGNIVVRGTVEGATIQAAGDVVVSEGINGMNRGSIVAGGNIKCKYIQSSYLKAGQAIYADSIMYCNMECQGNVELSGKRGVLIGGRSTVSGYLSAKTVGTDSHIATHIIMQNEDKKLIEEKKELAARLKEIEAEQLKLSQIINRITDMQKKTGKTTEELNNTLKTAATTITSLRMESVKTTVRLQEVEQEQLRQSRDNNCYIECKGRIHAGVQLTFGPLNYNVQQSFVFSRVHIVDNDIAITPLTTSGS